jgi:prolyl 4-hydroxylase
MITILDTQLTTDECNDIIAIGSEKLTTAKTLGEQIDGYRTAQESWITEVNPLINKLKFLVKTYTGLPIENQEAPHFILYEIGGEYKQHYDFFHKGEDYYDSLMSRGGQRVFSCLFYLNEDFLGGETLFPNKRIAVTPKTGRLLIWKNVLDNGQVDYESLHAGLPVVEGVKKIIVIWVRENKFNIS